MAFPQTAAPTETAFAVAATDHNVGMPPTVNSGNLLIMKVSAFSNTTLTEPSGWTRKWEAVRSSFVTSACFVRKADGTEGGTTVNVVSAASVSMSAQVYRVTDWFEDLAGVEAGTEVDGSGTTPDPPSLTASWGAEDNLWFAFGGAGDDDVAFSGAPTSYGNLVSTISGAGANAGCSAGSARRELNAAADDPSAFTLDSSESWVANTLVVRPAADQAIGIANETDSAQAVGSAKNQAIGLAAETDTAFGISATFNTPVGLALETDSAFGITPVLASAAGDLWGEDDRVLALVASFFDETIETDFDGPPVPFGTQAFGAELDGWTSVGAESQIYLSDIGYTSKPDDDPANTHFAPRLVSSFQYHVRIVQGDEPTGRARPVFGEITIANPDGGLDDILEKGWDGRTLRYYEGRKNAEFSTFTLRAVLTTDGLRWDEEKILVQLRDHQGIFARTIAADFYSGDGDLDGDANIAGLARPQAYGECFNVEPVQVNAANRIYQFHDRRAQEVVAVRDRGVDLTLDSAVGTNGDAADYTALAAASVTSGQYATALSQGLIRLGADPDGRVTADVKGDALGSYVDTAGGIVRRIVTTRMGQDSLDDPDGLDLASFNTLDSDQGSNIGFYLGTDRRNVDDILDEIMASVGGFWDMTLLGRLHVAVLTSPSGTAADTLTEADIAQQAKLQRAGLRPAKIHRVGYQRMWTVQNPDELASGVSAANRALYSREFRFALASDQGVAAKHKLAREVEVRSLFADQADADTEAGRRQTLYGSDLSLYSVRVRRSEFARNIGDVIDVQDLGRFGFSSLQKFRLVGKRADATNGQTLWELLG